MLGEYGDKENNRRLEEFQNRDTDETEFMLVMNKANEGLHLDKLDGIIWLRALDENSRILYLQQLGRAIYSEDPDNPTKDEDRPVVIDLVNNTLKVNWDNEITEQDDIELLTIIVDWAEKHDGTLPDINSNDKEESGYAIVLKDIQNKYKEYLDYDFEDLNENQIEEVQEILRLGSLIDLWQRELPDRIAKNGGDNRKGFGIDNGSPFEIVGVLKDFVELEDEVDEIEGRNAVERFIEKLEKLQGIGVDVSKIVNRDTIQTLAEKSGISEEQVKEIGLDPNDNIGMSRSHIAQVYRGKNKGKRPTEEQVEKIKEYGISLEKQERDLRQEFIEMLEKLEEIEVDVSKIENNDTIKTLAEKSGISEEQVKETGLDPNDKIGQRKYHISQGYRGIGTYGKPTEEQEERIKEFGIILEKQERDVIAEFIEKLEKLQGIGVDVSKIEDRDTVKTLAEKSGISEEQVKKIGLEPNDKIGQSKSYIAQSYRGIGYGVPPTEEQVARIKEFRIPLEKVERNSIDEFIEDMQKLQSIDVDVSKMVQKDTILTLARKSGKTEKDLKKIGLDTGKKIGSKANDIVKAYRGKGSHTPPTEQQAELLKKFGITLEKVEGNSVDKFIEKMQKLQLIDVDVSKIVQRDTILTLAMKSGKTEDDVKKIGLDPKERIGAAKNSITQAYRGRGTNARATEDQANILLKMGISLEGKKRTSKEIAEASISSLKDIEMADEEDKALREEVEKTKEGGILISE